MFIFMKLCSTIVLHLIFIFMKLCSTIVLHLIFIFMKLCTTKCMGYNCTTPIKSFVIPLYSIFLIFCFLNFFGNKNVQHNAWGTIVLHNAWGTIVLHLFKKVLDKEKHCLYAFIMKEQRKIRTFKSSKKFRREGSKRKSCHSSYSSDSFLIQKSFKVRMRLDGSSTSFSLRTLIVALFMLIRKIEDEEDVREELKEIVLDRWRGMNLKGIGDWLEREILIEFIRKSEIFSEGDFLGSLRKFEKS